MAFSIEARLPFLDPDVAEFALSIPAGLTWREHETKPLLRDAVRDLVPDVILDRRDKIGYETPQERWFASPEGRARLAEVLLDPSVGAPLERGEIESDLAAGRWRDSGAIWRALSVELWRR
jgi:asparagine synthase (glutamine-hydrolysing)